MRKTLSFILLIFVFIVVQLPMIHASATPSMIRVALFIETGGAYNLSLPSITFTGSQDINVLSKTKNLAYLTIPATQPVQFSLNQFRILVDETTDLLRAEDMVKKINEPTATILSYIRQGKPIYRIIVGNEWAYDQAVMKLTTLKTQFGVGKEILGSYALSAGQYQTPDEAITQVQSLLDAGFDAEIAYGYTDTNTITYYAVVGNEGTEAEQASLLQEVLLHFPNLTLTPINSNNLLISQTAMVNQQRVPHYYLPTTDPTLLQSVGDGLITITEKGNRQYRGVMELSLNKGKLAVINELSMDQYLFSVVGTEMATGWPIEALKSQAVIARTYAIAKGNQYGIANVTDTTYDQAYYGVKMEAPDVKDAVLQTSGQVLTYQGKVIEAYYSSNAGGMTAMGREVWGKELPYLSSVSSPDQIAAERSVNWYRVERENGTYGYVRSDLVTTSGSTNSIELMLGQINSNAVNFRAGPSTATKSLDKFQYGEKVVILESVTENNAFSWIEGPVDGVTLMSALNSRLATSGTLPLTTVIEDLQVAERGPSGRVISMTANGLPIKTSSPDSFRTILGGLRSTLFEIEEQGAYTVLGAGGKQVEYPQTKDAMTILGAGNQTAKADENRNAFVVYNKEKPRVVTTYPSFRFIGHGYGHGFGLSQWGARGLAIQGYDYQQILKHYYSELVQLVTIE